MEIQILRYDPVKHHNQLITIIKSEGKEWKDYLTSTYVKALDESITYVACVDGQVCGYSRSINDNDIFVWVVDLLIHKDFRGHAIGKRLMEAVRDEFPRLDVYVMSDVDDYYGKLGYPKEGSIFRVSSDE